MPTALQNDTQWRKQKKAVGVTMHPRPMMTYLRQISDKQAHCDLDSEPDPTLLRGRNTLTVNFTMRTISTSS